MAARIGVLGVYGAGKGSDCAYKEAAQIAIELGIQYRYTYIIRQCQKKLFILFTEYAIRPLFITDDKGTGDPAILKAASFAVRADSTPLM